VVGLRIAAEAVEDEDLLEEEEDNPSSNTSKT
jgi:hypothetical protein